MFINETDCYNCTKADVCSVKKEYLFIQQQTKQINTTEINTTEINTTSEEMSCRYAKDNKNIKIKLSCSFYQEKITNTRMGGGSI